MSNFFATVIMTLTPLLILRELDFSATVLGVGTVGGIAGAAALPAVRRRLRPGVVMAAGLCVAAASTALYPATGSAAGSPIVLVLLTAGKLGMTFSAVLFNITQISARQRVCPPRLLGRMTSSIRFVVWGSMPVAAVVAGWLGSWIGVVPAMWVGVVGTCLTVLPIIGMDQIRTAHVAERGERSDV